MKRGIGMMAAGLTLAVASMPASADPYAGQYDYLATGTLTVKGADGARWLLAVAATSSGPVGSRPEQHLYVDLDRCVGDSCAPVGRWTRPLTAADIAITSTNNSLDGQPSTGRLRTVLGGLSLNVALDGGDVAGGTFHGLGSTTSPPGVAPAMTQYTFATGRVDLGGITCEVSRERRTATIGRVTVVDTLGNDTRKAPPANLPAGFLRGKARAHCS